VEIFNNILKEERMKKIMVLVAVVASFYAVTIAQETGMGK